MQEPTRILWNALELKILLAKWAFQGKALIDLRLRAIVSTTPHKRARVRVSRH
jgi:hypothetical protein